MADLELTPCSGVTGERGRSSNGGRTQRNGRASSSLTLAILSNSLRLQCWKSGLTVAVGCASRSAASNDISNMCEGNESPSESLLTGERGRSSNGGRKQGNGMAGTSRLRSSTILSNSNAGNQDSQSPLAVLLTPGCLHYLL